MVNIPGLIQFFNNEIMVYLTSIEAIKKDLLNGVHILGSIKMPTPDFQDYAMLKEIE